MKPEFYRIPISYWGIFHFIFLKEKIFSLSQESLKKKNIKNFLNKKIHFFRFSLIQPF